MSNHTKNNLKQVVVSFGKIFMLCWKKNWEILIETWVSIVTSTKFAIFGIIHQFFYLKNLKKEPCKQGYDWRWKHWVVLREKEVHDRVRNQFW
jgi:hypothetical protein